MKLRLHEGQRVYLERKDIGFTLRKWTSDFPDRKDSGLSQKEKRMDLPFVNEQRIFPESKDSGFNLRVKTANLP
jgi:hypothetical protein